MPYRKSTFKAALGFKGTVLSNYKEQINRQDKLLDVIKHFLPVRLAVHALYCVISERKVSLYTDSAIWSSQLRFYHQTLLKAILASNIGVFESLQIKIIPQVKQVEKQDTKEQPSETSINLILNAAKHQQDDTLKTSLLNLGATFKRKSKE